MGYFQPHVTRCGTGTGQRSNHCAKYDLDLFIKWFEHSPLV